MKRKDKNFKMYDLIAMIDWRLGTGDTTIKIPVFQIIKSHFVCRML